MREPLQNLLRLLNDLMRGQLCEKMVFQLKGNSIMGLLMLAASQGSSIEVETRGAELEALAKALFVLVSDRFGEEA